VASKAAGFAIILRVFYAIFESDPFNAEWTTMIAILSAISMCVGNLIAIRQDNIKRLLAYSTVAQAGYLMVGLAAMSTLPGGEDNAGPAGILFYTVGYAMTNLTAFSVIIAISTHTKNDHVNSLAGLGRKSPFLASAMTLAMISLIGIPPTVGFVSKIYIFGSAMDTGLEWLAFVGVLNSVVSAYYYLRVVKIMFLSQIDRTEPINPGIGATSAATIAMAATFIFGLYPTPIIELAQTAVKSIVG
jgi:NADH-quinone oxidoreductase subunit N